MAEDNETPSGDRPLSDPEQDRLGYKSFAGYLASAITQMTPVDGLVIAIYGPWGAGKSTLLNFIARSLSELPQQHRPEVILFNPG